MKYKTLFIIIFVFLILILIPIFILGNYTVPQIDDFGFSGDVYHAVRDGGSVFDMLSAAAYRAYYTYMTWQGSFSAIFLMALQPGVLGFKYYTITTYLMVLSLLGGIFFLCKRILCDLFGINKYVMLIIAAVSSIICTQFVPFPYETFFWYNGAIYYTFFFNLSLFVYGSCSGYITRGGKWRIALITLLCLFIGGGNYMTALATVVVTALLIVFCMVKKDKKWKAFILPFLAITISLIFSMKAPGNTVRVATGPNISWIIGTFPASVKAALEFMKEQIKLPFVALVLFLVPIMFKECGSCERDFKFPWLITLLSFGYFVSMFVPHIYAHRSPGSARLFDIYYYALVLLVIFNVFYWIGWIRRKRAIEKSDNINLAVTALAAALAGFAVVISVYKYGATLTSAMALGELRSGEAQSFYAEMLEREKIYEDENTTDVVLEPLKNTPYLIFYKDMGDDPDYFMNEDTATYYGKDSIVVK